MNWLFVSTAKENLSEAQQLEQPRAGNILVYQLSEKLGVEAPKLTLPSLV